MNLAAFAIVFLLDLVLSAAFLWVGMKAASKFAGMPGSGQFCGYADLLKVALGASLVSLIPYVGWVLSFVVMFYLLRRVTGAELRDLLIMVLISRIVAIAAVVYVGFAF